MKKIMFNEVWKEPINEEELDKMAEESNPNNPHGDTYEVGQYFGFDDGFKAGATKQQEKDIEKFVKYAEKFNKENAEMGIKARIDVNSMERWASEIIYGDPFKGILTKWESCEPLIQKFERAMKGE